MDAPEESEIKQVIFGATNTRSWPELVCGVFVYSFLAWGIVKYIIAAS